MRAFIIPQGTPITVIRVGAEWVGQNFHASTTTRENMFFVEDLRVDPLGAHPLACGPVGVTVGASWARNAYYGFQRAGEPWYCLVASKYVTVG